MDNEKTHVFESAGLGKAPYRFLGVQEKIYKACHDAPAQPGGTCQYCSNGIRYCYWLRSADGKEFYVGSECINKAGDRGLKRAVNKAERERKLERDKERISKTRAIYESDPTIRQELEKRPHPYGYMADKGHTLAGFVDFMLNNGGISGKIKACRVIEKEVKQR